jgi:hypothetical protein
MAATPNLLGNADDAALRPDVETEPANEAPNAMTPRAAAAVPETRRAEQPALLRPKITAPALQSPH